MRHDALLLSLLEMPRKPNTDGIGDVILRFSIDVNVITLTVASYRNTKNAAESLPSGIR